MNLHFGCGQRPCRILFVVVFPSVVVIIYAMTAGASVGELFIGGIIPGLILAALFIAYIVVITWFKAELAPAAPPEERSAPLRQKLALLKGLIIPG